ncbi:hopanoid biosynthesis-associated protein HpnK [Novosphingobium terrae]|uniref:hopanoid biosynthesis-associated protein HpnK n=1 Tax=Novosphingobium terrae TaxID=2726189 RepID=UPI00197E90A1
MSTSQGAPREQRAAGNDGGGLSRKRLVVTADDFGAAIAVNEAVERAHVDGILTAASLMVAGEGAADAVERARRLPNLGVGLHVVLVDGQPILPPEQIPALVGPDGWFQPDMVKTAFAIAFNPAARAQMRAEVKAQFAAFAATGLKLDHVNAHKHFHMHPMITSAILDAGKASGIPGGIPAMRVPVEHGSSGFGPAAMRWWAGLLGRRLKARGIMVNDQVMGLAQTGAFTPQAMEAALAALPEGLTELYTHPATQDVWPGSAAGYRYRDELAALVAPATIAAVSASRARIGPFAQFQDNFLPTGTMRALAQAGSLGEGAQIDHRSSQKAAR